MTKRDLQADLAWINDPDVCISPKVREICNHAIRRAMEAEEEVKRLREDMNFLQQEYRDSEEPMTQDALELKARLKILQERDELRAEVRRLKIEIAVLTNTPTGQDIVAAYKRAEAENERLREALDLLFRITCTNGADPDDVKPPVGRANWSSADRERALRLAKEALEVRE